MKLIKLSIVNFGSYDQLEFHYDTDGLTLIQGSTGSGKSTLLDAAAWVLFGITAKDGSVDDVRSWNNSLSPTHGDLTVETANGIITITRIRGKSHENDLYFVDNNNPGFDRRGKDIKETQNLINTRLGFDSYTYLAGSYFCEHTPSTTFFLGTAKQRRELFEKIANMEFSTKLLDRLKILGISMQQDSLKIKNTINILNEKFDYIQKNLQASFLSHKSWNENEQIKVKSQELERYNQISRYSNEILFTYKKLETVDPIEYCKECGRELNHTLEESYKRTINELQERLESAEKLKFEMQPNPFQSQIDRQKIDLDKISTDLESYRARLSELERSYYNITILSELTLQLKKSLLENAIILIESKTNVYLETYFDSQFRISLSLKTSDSLEMNIYKDDHLCEYRQLSKGQRQLLKLTCAVALMKAVENRFGMHFDNLFFDESLDGMDTDLKTKAFNLFNSLAIEHKSIFVVDHAEEFKNLFTTNYTIELINDMSVIANV